MRSDMRSASFSSSADEDHAFTFDAHFDWNGKLGSGSFADVYAVRHKTRPDETYAVKVLKKEMGSRQDRAAYLREVELANTLPPHPHIVSYLRAWQDECILYVQMELCVGGTLREQMAARPLHTRACDGVVWRLVRQVASALAHIHSAYLIHCDVKPDNVLLDKRGNYKVGDLGQATALSSWDEQEGDARYIAADLLHGNPAAAADIFSFGIMLLEIKSNRPLPGHGDEWKALRATDAAPLLRARMHQQAPQQAAGVEEGGEGAPHTAAVDARLERLVISMMSTAPAERPDAKAVGDACPWPVEPQTRSIGMRLLRAAFRGVNAFSSTRRATKGGMI
jgi:serine/threonine protein kinase